MHRSTTILALVLLLGIFSGLALQPDDGTAVTRPPGVGLKVDGADHAKPLHRVPSAADLLATLSVAVAGLLLLLVAVGVRRTRRDDERTTVPADAFARARARRGPPALA